MPGQSNVVVDADGHARITDFCFATVVEDTDSEKIASDQHPEIEIGCWSAPEILEDESTSKATDIYSFAMVMIEARHEWSTVCVALFNPCPNTGICPNNARQYSTYHNRDGHSERQASAATCTSWHHGRIVEVDKTVLG